MVLQDLFGGGGMAWQGWQMAQLSLFIFLLNTFF